MMGIVMARSGFALLLLALTAASTAPAAAECLAFAAPAIPNCKPVNVSAVVKSYLDLYRIEAGKPVFDRSVKTGDICVPFKATDCGVAGYLMIEVADHTRLLFRTSDLKDEAPTCTCDRTAQTTVAGAPGAGKPNLCPPAMCQ